jgi:hypothetical protein
VSNALAPAAIERLVGSSHVLFASQSPARAPIPLHNTPATENSSPPESAGTKPPIVEPIKIAIQVRDISQISISLPAD